MYLYDLFVSVYCSNAQFSVIRSKSSLERIHRGMTWRYHWLSVIWFLSGVNYFHKGEP